jgi:hypothetical protein
VPDRPSDRRTRTNKPRRAAADAYANIGESQRETIRVSYSTMGAPPMTTRNWSLEPNQRCDVAAVVSQASANESDGAAAD